MAIDFSLTPELEAIRMRIRTFVDEVIKPEEAKLEGHVRLSRQAADADGWV